MLTLTTPSAHRYERGTVIAIAGESFEVVRIASQTVVEVKLMTRWRLWCWRTGTAVRACGRLFQRLWWRVVDAV